jgi:hypothetical protein
MDQVSTTSSVNEFKLQNGTLYWVICPGFFGCNINGFSSQLEQFIDKITSKDDKTPPVKYRMSIEKAEGLIKDITVRLQTATQDQFEFVPLDWNSLWKTILKSIPDEAWRRQVEIPYIIAKEYLELIVSRIEDMVYLGNVTKHNQILMAMQKIY